MSLGKIRGQGGVTHSVTLMEFLGGTSNEIDTLVLDLAVMEDRPEWLRGVRSTDELPRYCAGEYRTFYSLELPPNRAEVVAWVITELIGPWTLRARRIFLELDVDAIKYRFRWG